MRSPSIPIVNCPRPFKADSQHHQLHEVRQYSHSVRIVSSCGPWLVSSVVSRSDHVRKAFAQIDDARLRNRERESLDGVGHSDSLRRSCALGREERMQTSTADERRFGVDQDERVDREHGADVALAMGNAALTSASPASICTTSPPSISPKIESSNPSSRCDARSGYPDAHSVMRMVVSSPLPT